MKYYIYLIAIFVLFSFNYVESNATNQDDISSLENKAMNMINASKYNESIFYLDQILEIDPENIGALNNKGGILIQSGNYTDAIANFDKILLIDENNTQALNNKAISLSKQGLFIESLKVFHKSLLSDPSNDNTLNNTRNLMDKLYWLDETAKSFGVVKTFDKNGDLVGYSKIHQILVQPPLGYITLKNAGAVLQEIEINGEKHEALFFNKTIPVLTNEFISSAYHYLPISNDVQFKTVEIILNGFIGTFTDTVRYEFVIIDPPY